MYNLTFMNTSNDIVQAVKGINDNSNSMFLGLILIALWIIVYGSSMKLSDKQLSSFIGASIATSVVSILFFGAGLVKDYVVFFPLLMTVVGIIVKIMIGDDR